MMLAGEYWDGRIVIVTFFSIALHAPAKWVTKQSSVSSRSSRILVVVVEIGSEYYMFWAF